MDSVVTRIDWGFSLGDVRYECVCFAVSDDGDKACDYFEQMVEYMGSFRFKKNDNAGNGK